MVKNPPAMQESKETQVQSLGQGDPLEEGMATHSSILAWRSPQTEEPGGLQPMGSQRLRQTGAMERSAPVCTEAQRVAASGGLWCGGT